MNTKMMTLVSTLTLILATSASAQMISILPGGRGNLYIGTPTTLPGPMSNITISPRISLPAPLLAPSITVALAPAPTPAQVPVPVVVPVLPVTPVMPALPVSVIPEHMWNFAMHDNVPLPYPSALRAQLSAPSKDGSAKDAAASREKLDNLFDGRKPNEKGASDDRGPVRSDRHQSLPEHDLESEIGAY
jgi:hypothetical protein